MISHLKTVILQEITKIIHEKAIMTIDSSYIDLIRIYQ